MDWMWEKEPDSEITMKKGETRSITLLLAWICQPLLVTWSSPHIPADCLVTDARDSRTVHLTVPEIFARSHCTLNYKINDSSGFSDDIYIRLTDTPEKGSPVPGLEDNSISTEAGSLFTFTIPELAGRGNECTVDWELRDKKPAEGAVTEGPVLTWQIPADGQGFYTITYRVDGVEGQGRLFLKVLPPAKPIPREPVTCPKEEEERAGRTPVPADEPPASGGTSTPAAEELPAPPPVTGDCYIAVLVKGKEEHSLRRDVKADKSMIIGRYSSSLALPDIDLKPFFSSKDASGKCSRHQLKIFRSGMHIYASNTGSRDIELNGSTFPAGSTEALRAGDRCAIAGEIELELRKK